MTKGAMNGRSVRVTQLRDAAVKFAKTNGKFEPCGAGARVIQCHGESLSVFLTEFPLVLCIDIWDHKRKVMNMRSNDTAISVSSFRRGDWEEQLLNVADQEPAIAA